jgi:hypothetical protein
MGNTPTTNSKTVSETVMPVEPINITALLATLMGISIVLVPVIGLTARFALKPVVEALAKVLEARGTDESVNILERRIGLLEAQIESMEGTVNRLADAAEFDAQLRSGADRSTGQLPSP